MIVGCYSMDLYCDCPIMAAERWCDVCSTGLGARQATGRTEAECFRAVKRWGWIVNKATDRVICLECRPHARMKVEPKDHPEGPTPDGHVNIE